MRVAYSLLTLTPGVSGGSETYARGLASALAARGVADVTAFVPRLAPEAGEGLPSVVVDEYRTSASTTRRMLALMTARLRPGRLTRHYAGMDAVHYPLTVPVPALRLPTVVTLHDTQHLDLPELFGAATRRYRSRTYDEAARRADAVVVPSVFVRERAIALLGLDPARTHAIHLAVDHERFRPGPEERERFLFYPARPWPHKNHERLFAALQLLRADDPALTLVLTGVGVERFAGIDGVDARGAVGSEELLSLYRRAACVVFPSRYEGFGFPPLEAMACGTPVAAADAASIPEVVGDAAVLFDPDNAEAIANGVREALDRTHELRVHGLQRAAAFTWDRIAEEHEAIYSGVG